MKQTLDLLSAEDVTLTAMGNKAMMKGRSSQERMSQFVSGLLAEIIKTALCFLPSSSGGQNVKGLFAREEMKQSDFCTVSLTVHCYPDH